MRNLHHTPNRTMPLPLPEGEGRGEGERIALPLPVSFTNQPKPRSARWPLVIRWRAAPESDEGGSLVISPTFSP